MSVKWPDDAEEKIDQVMDDKNKEFDFVVFTMDKKGSLTCEDGHMGKGGRAEVEKILEASPDKVMTGVFLILAVDDREVTVSIRRKYVQFIWVGSDVGIMQKGRVNSQSGEMKQKFMGAHVQLQLNQTLDELSEVALERTLRACGGAHQPTKFDFTNTATEEED